MPGALSQEYELLKTILDSMTEQFFGLSRDWRFTYVNRNAAEQMKRLGKDPVALIGKVLWDEFPEVPNEADLRRVMSERIALTDELYYAPLGEWVENHMCPSADGGLVAFQRYITGRKRAEERLRRSESHLAEGQKITRTGSWGWNIGSGDVFWSEQQYRMFGWDPKGPPPNLAQAFELIHPEDRELVRQLLESAVREARRGDWVCRIITRDGTVKHVHTTTQPVLEAGRPVEYIGITVDITERMESEAALRRSQEALAQATRMLTVGTLASSMAHELGQPLAAVVANGSACLRWLNRDDPDLDEARGAAGRIVRDGMRAGEMMQRMRAFVQHGRLQKTSFQLAELVAEVVSLVQTETEAQHVAVRTYVADNLPAVEADRMQISQVMLNLAVNAIEAMSTTTGRPRLLEIGVYREGADEVGVTLADSGPGLDPVRLEKPFDLFHTTKPHGLGMGLAISRSIVEGHGGRLWASSLPGKGATFHFVLPTTRQS
jgi:PAS domain S-box-containing protein